MNKMMKGHNGSRGTADRKVGIPLPLLTVRATGCRTSRHDESDASQVP